MLSSGSKRSNCEADDSHPSKAEVMHEWSSTLLLLYALTTVQGELYHFVRNLQIVTLIHAAAFQQANTVTCFVTCIEWSIRNWVTDITNILRSINAHCLLAFDCATVRIPIITNQNTCTSSFKVLYRVLRTGNPKHQDDIVWFNPWVTRIILTFNNTARSGTIAANWDYVRGNDQIVRKAGNSVLRSAELCFV
jgi:hypothetical protein